MMKVFTRPFYKPSTGIGRGKGKRNTKGKSAAPSSPATATGSTLEVNDMKASSVEQLRELAQKGEFPRYIQGENAEATERLYEEFDRLYPDPPGILNEYTVEKDPISSRRIIITFKNDYAEVESPGEISLPTKKSSETVRSGVIKHAIYGRRSAVEVALSSRRDGYSTYEMAAKYGFSERRLLTDAQKAEATRDMESYILKMLKSPISRQGKEWNDAMWVHEDGGWRRFG